ncbi:hypothetical protein FBQ97_00695 [Acidobacteria bacterium ACD]|nr:hypothetical protein [Acidobacteria bacterium ACD]
MTMSFEPRRGVFVEVRDDGSPPDPLVPPLLSLDAVYRSLCALLYNYVPTSGHPGGSISSGRFVAALLFEAMDYDVSRPGRTDADLVSYAAGHKAMGLYAMWALRDEVLRVGAPDLLPASEADRLRLEDLLGFRRNPAAKTPLFTQLRARALDGHPTPATPFLRLATGASGVGVASSFGLALGALDTYGADAPRVHVVEGEGGLTPGRVAEAVAFAGTAGLSNLVLHLDWNQSSIDSDRVAREGAVPGEYVAWSPTEFFHLHDWNVVFVPDGLDLAAILRAQRAALALDNGQPTAVVYRTKKGFGYGIEGRASHGAGHKLCSEGFYAALLPAVRESALALPACEPGNTRCGAGSDPVVVEECFWQSLRIVRSVLEENRDVAEELGGKLRRARERLDRRSRKPRSGAPRLEAAFEAAAGGGSQVPEGLALVPGTETTLRGQLGKVLGHLNAVSGGAVLVAAADLLGSTSVSEGNKGFPPGFFHASLQISISHSHWLKPKGRIIGNCFPQLSLTPSRIVTKLANLLRRSRAYEINYVVQQSDLAVGQSSTGRLLEGNVIYFRKTEVVTLLNFQGTILAKLIDRPAKMLCYRSKFLLLIFNSRKRAERRHVCQHVRKV